jgi:acyl-CoA thioesterase-1
MPLLRFPVAALVVALLLLTNLTNCIPDQDAPVIPTSAPVFVALGASDAVGVGALDPETGGWAPRVRAALPPDTQYINLGVSGATLRDVVERQLPQAQAAHPDLVILWPGINDLRAFGSLGTFQQRLDQIVSTLSTGSTQVIVLNIPQLQLLPVFAFVPPAVLDGIIRDWNGAIAAVVERYDATLVDLYDGSLELAQHPEYVSSDGFHPSDAGYQRIAELILAEIRVLPVLELEPAAVR